MRDWKKIGKKLLFPPIWIIVLLTVTCIVCWKLLPGYYKSVKSKMLAINLIYVVVNAVSGYVYRTYWFAIFAVYYAIIAMMRFLLVRYVIKSPILSITKVIKMASALFSMLFWRLPCLHSLEQIHPRKKRGL